MKGLTASDSIPQMGTIGKSIAIPCKVLIKFLQLDIGSNHPRRSEIDFGRFLRSL